MFKIQNSVQCDEMHEEFYWKVTLRRKQECPWKYNSWSPSHLQSISNSSTGQMPPMWGQADNELQIQPSFANSYIALCSLPLNSTSFRYLKLLRRSTVFWNQSFSFSLASSCHLCSHKRKELVTMIWCHEQPNFSINMFRNIILEFIRRLANEKNQVPIPKYITQFQIETIQILKDTSVPWIFAVPIFH